MNIFHMKKWKIWFGLVTSLLLFSLSLWFIEYPVNYLATTIYSNISHTTVEEIPRTAYAIPNSSMDIQYIGGRGEGLGCSFPLNYLKIGERLVFKSLYKASNPVSLRMRQACNFHDYCYRHGAATYGYKKHQCDNILLRQLNLLCNWTTNNQSTGIPYRSCHNVAKKILLGVRYKGASSFRRSATNDKNEKSTYFEFDPYPSVNYSYTIFRVADAPLSLQDADNTNKAIYIFKIRNSSTQLTIMTWHKNKEKDTRSEKCLIYRLPAADNIFNIAPVIVNSSSNKDWLVWWNRERGDTEKSFTTGGSFSGVKAISSSLKEWSILFPGATKINKERECKINKINNEELGSKNKEYKFENNTLFKNRTVGFDISNPSTSDFLQIISTPGIEPNKKYLRLMSLRATCSCNNENICNSRSVLCFKDINIDISKTDKPKDKFENLFIRDQYLISRKNHYERYYSAIPIVMGNKKKPILGIFTKKEVSYLPDNIIINGLRKMFKLPDANKIRTILRRFKEDNNKSRTVDILELDKFKDEYEPAILLNRTSDPILISITCHSKECYKNKKIILRYWKLPKSENKSNSIEKKLIKSKELSLKYMGNTLDQSWILRPVISFFHKNKPTNYLIFSRIIGKTFERKIEILVCSLNFEKNTSKFIYHKKQGINEITPPPLIVMNKNKDIIKLILANKTDITKGLFFNIPLNNHIANK